MGRVVVHQPPFLAKVSTWRRLAKSCIVDAGVVTLPRPRERAPNFPSCLFEIVQWFCHLVSFRLTCEGIEFARYGKQFLMRCQWRNSCHTVVFEMLSIERVGGLCREYP